MDDITRILQDWNNDRDAAIAKLTPLVYSELHKIAESNMRRANPDQTLQATALINEAYLRLVKQGEANYQSRSHFFALAAKIMRAVLVDVARARGSQKRGSGKKVQLNEGIDIAAAQSSEFLALHEALERLKKVDERRATVVELRFFGGLSFQEIADLQGTSLITAKRDSAFAEAWLRRELGATS